MGDSRPLLPEECLVIFQPSGRRSLVPAGTTLLEAGRRAGLLLTAACGGVGLCGKCQVEVVSGQLTDAEEDERDFLRDAGRPGNRLACVARVLSAVVVDVPAELSGAGQVLQLDVADQLEIIDPPHMAQAGQKSCGLAVDVGCTKIAAYLIDLQSGQQLAAAATPNPQIPYGEDLISRLVYAAESADHAMELAGRVREGVAALAEELCAAAGTHTNEIADACVVGNTAMMHLLLAWPVKQLLHAPFVSAREGAQDLAAAELGWRFAAAARVHVLPGIGGFVGADHVAMVLAEDIDRTEKITVGIDIGTNTEIVVRDAARGQFLTTSVPSGPVFEGGHIGAGMRAATGAIDRFYVQDGQLRYHTIGEAKPVGICGSGVLDLLASLRRLGAVNERGHLASCHGKGEKASVLLVAAAESGHGREIVFTQHDVSQVQLAKAAIYAGITTLLGVAGIAAEEVQEMVVAGQFGSYLDLSSALSIGMLPVLAKARYRQVGNAAGRGAKLALVSLAARERARQIALQARKVELKQHREFDLALARATRFPALKGVWQSLEITATKKGPS